MSDGRSIAEACRRRQHELVGTRVEPWAYGTAVRADDVPTFYDYNLVRVEGEDPGVDAAALAAAAEAAHEGLEHRRMEVFDRAAGERLRPGFAALGWRTDRLAFLHRTLPAPAAPAPAGVELRVEGFEASRPLRDAWRGETVYADGPEFVIVEERVARRRGTNATVAYARDEPVAFAAASCHDGTVEIELAFVRPERRGGGLGAAVIGRSLEDAAARGARDALIEADDEGDAKRLYERLGFRTVWVRHVFTRLPARA